MDKDLRDIVDGKGLENADLYTCKSICIRKEGAEVKDIQTALLANNIVIIDENSNFLDFKDTESVTISSSSAVGFETVDLKLWVKMLKRQRRYIKRLRIKHFLKDINIKKKMFLQENIEFDN